MKKILLGTGALLLVFLMVYSQRANIAARVLEKGMAAQLGFDRIATLEDGLHVILCGAGGPLPAPNASGPCVAIIAGTQLLVVDAGTDGVRNLARMGYAVGDIESVLLTHYHSDHIDGLGELGTLRWAGGDNTLPLPVYGPTGVERVVEGFNIAYAQDSQFRHAHHGDAVAPLSGAGLTARPFQMPEMGALTVVYESGELRVTALAVDHTPVAPAVGYRFDYKGRSALITGDTVKHDNIERFAQGVDLLVHEALAPNLVSMMHEAAVKNGNSILARITTDILDYHASPMDAAQTARDARVGHLLYYHIVPPLIVPGQKALFLNGADDVFPDYTIGKDGVEFSLPAGSQEIVLSRSNL